MEQSYLPPSDVKAEKSVLSCLINVTNSFDQISDTFITESFYDNQNQVVALAIQQLVEQRISPDSVTIVQQLMRTKQLDNAGGAVNISILAQNPYYNIEQYYKSVFDKYLLRKAISFASQTIASAYEGSLDGAQVLGTLKDGIDSLEKQMHVSKTQSTRSIVNNALQSIKDAKINNGVLGPSTGLRDLDVLLRGLRPPDVIVIAGRPAMGKTAIVLCIAKALCIEQNIPVAVFSLEMSGEQLVHRLLSDLSEINNNILSSGKLSEFEDKKLDIAQKRINDNFNIDDTPAITIQYFESKIRKLAAAGVKFAIIDYLQLMTLSEKDRKGRNREQEISYLTQNIKRIAKKYNIGVIELSQLSRACEERTPPRPMLSDLRESGSIEQDADIVIFLYRPEYYNIEFSGSGKPTKGLAELIIAKHRNGAVDSVVVKFKGEFTRFEDLDEVKAESIEDTINNNQTIVHF